MTLNLTETSVVKSQLSVLHGAIFPNFVSFFQIFIVGGGRDFGFGKQAAG